MRIKNTPLGNFIPGFSVLFQILFNICAISSKQDFESKKVFLIKTCFVFKEIA